MQFEILTNIFFCIFGLLVGSFLNVVIYRVPRELSVVTPRSSCPQCKHKIRWFENLPVISYLFLKGKCLSCKTKISIRYPLIEIFVGFIAYFLAPTNLAPESLFEFIFYFSVACVFLAHFIIDIEFQLLPDKINLYLLAITLPFVMLKFSLAHWLIGGILGFGGPYLITYIFYKLRGVVGLGGGDIKLFGILGLILGPLGIMQNIFLSCLVGSIVGVGLILIKKMDKANHIAFGPYIIFAATVQIFFPALLEYIPLLSF